jgi:AraC-like DNA-binding protein
MPTRTAPTEAPYDYSAPDLLLALSRLCDVQFAGVPPILTPYVDAIFCNQPHPNMRALSVSRVPEGIVHIACDILDFSKAGGGTLVNQARLIASGAHTAIHPISLDVRETIVAQLRPGAGRAFLGISCDTIAGRIVNLEDVWGAAASAMLERIAAQRTSLGRTQVFVDLLTSRLSQRAEDHFVIQAAEAVRVLSPELGTTKLAAKLGYTERHLLRRFREDLGLSPKSFARANRLCAVLKSLGPAVCWADIAASHGFSHQSHLVREFRELVGQTPTEFVSTRPMLELLRLGMVVRPR